MTTTAETKLETHCVNPRYVDRTYVHPAEAILVRTPSARELERWFRLE